MKIKNPPIIVFVDGTSLIPSHGNHTQKIPPITSVNDSKVRSAAGIFLEPIEYKINPIQTKVPWVANKASFLPVDKKLAPLLISITAENKKQNNPANATVVNFGVSFLHLSETEKIEKPNAEISPNTNPGKVFFSELSKAIIQIPTAAIIIATHTVKEIFSFRNKKPNKAVINGIAARQSNVIAAVVLVIDHMNVIIAVPKPIPPTTPDIPTLK